MGRGQAYRALAPKICVAKWLVDVGRWYGVDEEQLVHVPMGLDHALFWVRAPLADRPVDVAMLYNPMPEKGWATGRAGASRSWHAAARDSAPLVFTLEEPPDAELPDGIEIVTGLDQLRLADEVYNRTKVMVQASRHEGFGLDGHRGDGLWRRARDDGLRRLAHDYARPGVTAEVVPRDDPVALADATEALLDDEPRRLELARAGERFVRGFDWERTGELLEACLERYVADPERYQRPPGEDHSEEYSL